jgi:hypothetical protein
MTRKTMQGGLWTNFTADAGRLLLNSNNCESANKRETNLQNALNQIKSNYSNNLS